MYFLQGTGTEELSQLQADNRALYQQVFLDYYRFNPFTLKATKAKVTKDFRISFSKLLKFLFQRNVKVLADTVGTIWTFELLHHSIWVERFNIMDENDIWQSTSAKLQLQFLCTSFSLFEIKKLLWQRFLYCSVQFYWGFYGWRCCAVKDSSEKLCTRNSAVL